VTRAGLGASAILRIPSGTLRYFWVNFCIFKPSSFSFVNSVCSRTFFLDKGDDFFTPNCNLEFLCCVVSMLIGFGGLDSDFGVNVFRSSPPILTTLASTTSDTFRFFGTGLFGEGRGRFGEGSVEDGGITENRSLVEAVPTLSPNLGTHAAILVS